MVAIFKTGDVVQLRSGGPRMTVASVMRDMTGRPMAYCEWFGDDKKHFDTFCTSSLQIIDCASERSPLSAQAVRGGS
jgi:uncharacterized protein YodC (DUF2158 family)